MPGHGLPNGSDHIPHMRQVAFPLDPVVQRDYDQDVCVCIACHTRCLNNTALRKHGDKEGHCPFGCVCGSAFGRLDVLERHITSKNKVTKYPCPLCEYDAKVFTRADHLPQHLRTFHKIPSGKIPEHFTSNMVYDGAVEDAISPPQSMPPFPCLIPGCMRTGELAYLRQVDLDEHNLFMHYVTQNTPSVEQQLDIPHMNYGSQQNPYSNIVMTFGQDGQQNNSWQPDPAANYQVNGGFLENDIVVGNLNSSLEDEFNFNFEWDFNFDV